MIREDILRIKSLSKRSEREALKQFVTEGVKNIAELASSPIDVEQIYYTQDLEEHVPEQLNDISIAVSSKSMERISQMKTPPGILAVSKIPETDVESSLNKMQQSKFPFALVADGIQDPGNLGTLIRSADWFGMKAIFVTEKTTDAWSIKCVQASMGSIFKVAILPWSEDLKEAQKHLKNYAMDMDGESFYGINWEPGLIWVGSESHGLQKALDVSHEKITIPRAGRAESLNAGVAGSIVCAEISRAFKG
jgi:TrmH family RNA methyltransferase